MSTLSFRRRSLPTFPPLFTISKAAASHRPLFSASLLGLGPCLWGCLAAAAFQWLLFGLRVAWATVVAAESGLV